MSRKTLAKLLLGTMVFFSSCVDTNYDLMNKEVSTSVEFEKNKLAIPIGNLKAYVLDSLLKSDNIEVLGKDENGVYCINMSDDIAPVELTIDPIKLAIDPQSQTIPIEFTRAEITDVKIEGKNPEKAGFVIPKISLDDLNISNIITNATGSAANDEIKKQIELLKSLSGDQFKSVTIEMNETFSLQDEEVGFNLNCTLPKEIKSISTIFLQTPGEENSSKGTLIGFKIIHPDAMKGMKKSIKFDIEFPDEFFLSKANTSEGKYTLTNNSHRLIVEDLIVEANSNKSTTVEFYLDKLDGLDDYIQDGQLKFNKVIKYTVEYTVHGELNLTKSSRVEDFEFKVETDLGLAFSDVAGETNDIEVAFDPIDLTFDIDLYNLQHIDRIERIDFDEVNSKLHFHAEMDGGFAPFSLKDGYALKLQFPKEIYINEEHSEYRRDAVKYDTEDHAFYIYDLEVLNGNPDVETDAHWNLALESFVLNKEVYNGEFHQNVLAEVSVVKDGKPTPNLVFEGTKMESLSQTLESLKNKDVEFTVWNSNFVIKDAVVHTEKITSQLDTLTVFELNEKVPNEITCIESVGFTEGVPIKIDMGITGLEQLEARIDLALQIELPSFLEFEEDPNITGNTLTINKPYYPSSGKRLELNLICTGLNFMNEEFDYKGLIPEVATDGNKYLSYKGNIAVLGDAMIEGLEFHSEVLNSMKDINLDVNFKIDDIQVKTFSGIYSREIEEVKQTIGLDLGEELAFLKSENNSITLAEPQIEIVIENSISVPVNINLQLAGKDEFGAVISTSVIETKTPIKINPATFDEATGEIIPYEAKLLLTSDTLRVSKIGYHNIQLENLSNLLQQIPDSIAFAIQPIIDQSETHHVDLSQPLKFKGRYRLNIPLKFDDFQLCYNDTIKDIQASLGETMETFSNIEVKLNMDIINTLPLGLTLDVKALDKDNNPINDITIQPITLKAGLGGDIITEGKQTQEAQSVTTAILSRTNDLQKLDRLVLNVDVATDHTIGAIGIKGSQGIQLTNIVLEVTGDIKTSF